MTMSKEISDGFRQVAADQISQDISIADTYAKKASLATVATTGSYTDLSNLPSSTTVEVVNYTVSTASAPSFTLSDVAYVQVFINSVLAREGESYSKTTTALTFTDTLPVGTHITLVKFITAGCVNALESITTALQELITEYGGEVPT